MAITKRFEKIALKSIVRGRSAPDIENTVVTEDRKARLNISRVRMAGNTLARRLTGVQPT